MNKQLILIMSPLLLAFAGCDAVDNMMNKVGESEEQRTAYAIGYSVGTELQLGLSDSFPAEDILKGIKDGLKNNPPQVEEGQIQELIHAFREKTMQQANAEMDVQSQANIERGDAFRAEYAKRDGVKKTESGIYYRIETPGGKKPKATDQVEVHYRGTLVDGTEFDSSFSRNETSTFPLDGVIRGWTEGVQLIGVGGKIELVLPPELAYGERGTPNSIGPNETLVFQVELVSIK